MEMIYILKKILMHKGFGGTGGNKGCPPHLRSLMMICYFFISFSISTIITFIPIKDKSSLLFSHSLLYQSLHIQIPSSLRKELAPLTHCTFTLCHNEVCFCLFFFFKWLFSVTLNFLYPPDGYYICALF